MNRIAFGEPLSTRFPRLRPGFERLNIVELRGAGFLQVIQVIEPDCGDESWKSITLDADDASYAAASVVEAA